MNPSSHKIQQQRKHLAPKPTQKQETTPDYKNILKIINVGGLEEIGRNMSMFEYNDKVLIIDMGIQFPESDMPGIDYIIPNVSYLTENKHKEIVGVIITHGHMDHFGAIPHLMPKLGNPPLYAARLTKGLILKRQSDYPEAGEITVNEFLKDDVLDLKAF